MWSRLADLFAQVLAGTCWRVRVSGLPVVCARVHGPVRVSLLVRVCAPRGCPRVQSPVGLKDRQTYPLVGRSYLWRYGNSLGNSRRTGRFLVCEGWGGKQQGQEEAGAAVGQAGRGDEEACV